MHLWKIQNGFPSIVDALLVTGGPLVAIGGAVSAINPLLNYFEPKGAFFLCLGYALVFLLLVLFAGAVGIPLYRIQKVIRIEIQFPRIVFIFCSTALILFLSRLTTLIPLSYVLEHKISLGALFYGVPIALILFFAVAYLFVASATVYFPAAVNRWVLYFALGLSVLGVIAKGAALFIRK